MTWRTTQSGLLVRGAYEWSRNSGPWERALNVITDEGADLINSGASASWYMALFEDDVTPDESWHASTFSSSAGELDGPPEGYQQLTRQLWNATPDDGAELPGGYRFGANINNKATPCEFGMRSASRVQVTGFALLSDDTKLSTSGVMLSAVRFGTGPQMFDNGDILVVRYTLETRRSP